MFGLLQDVRVTTQHWLRPAEFGKIIGHNKKQTRWLVQFRTARPGGGINGDQLYLEENQLELVPRNKKQ